MMLQELDKSDMSKLALICRNLFNEYAASEPTCSAPRLSAAQQQKRFLLWESDLAGFTRPSTSPQCDEIRALAMGQLSMIRTNLEFAAAHDQEFTGTPDSLTPEDTQRREQILRLEGTPSEALDAVKAAIDGLNELGEAIRQHPAIDHESPAEDHPEGGRDESGFETIKRVAQSNSPTASPFLHDHLAAWVLKRHRQRTKQRQQPTRIQQTTYHAGTRASIDSSGRVSDFPKSEANRQSRCDGRLEYTLRPHFNPISHARFGGSSIASSSQSSTTTIAGDDSVDYPEPPKAEHGKPAPQCPYRRKVLEDSDLSQPAWKHHVNHDLKPYICLFVHCDQRDTSFPDDKMWASHMNNSHGRNWPSKLRDSFNEGQATRTQSSSAKSRMELACPLCDSWSLTRGSKLPDESWQEAYQRDRLAEHIGNHLLRLALDSSDELEKNTNRMRPSSPSEETEAGSATLNSNPENSSAGESKSALGLDHSFSQDDEAVDRGNALNRNKHSSTLPNMGNLENCKSLQGESAPAEPVHQYTTQHRFPPLSSGRLQFLSDIVNTAKELFSQRKYRESEEEYRKALELCAEVPEASGLFIISIKGNLANALAEQGKHQEAEDAYREILAFSTETLGKRHQHRLSCRSNLASMLERKGEYEEAEAIYRDVWKLHQETLGNKHSDTISSYSKVANALTRLKSFSKATLIYEETLEMRREELGEKHPDTIITLGNLANSLQNQGQYREAEARYRGALAASKGVLKDDDPHLQWIKARLLEVTGEEGGC